MNYACKAAMLAACALGGESMTGFVGVNFAATGGALKGWRLCVEGGVPLVQDLNGPQMPND